MKVAFTAAALAFAFTFAHGAETAQQTKMATCNKDAGDKKGDERKAFIKDCLSAKKEEKKLTPQQEKMKACATENKGKKGAEYKKAQAECLKK